MPAADAALAARDRAIPGLALVLDGGAMRHALALALPHLDVRAVHPRYLRYKPGTSMTVSCRVEVVGPGGPASHLVTARAFGTSASAKLAKAADRETGCSPLGPGRIRLLDAGTIVTCYPHDDALPALARLQDPLWRERLVSRMTPSRPDLWTGHVSPLAYKPGRRFVGRLDVPVHGGDQPRAVLRLSARRDADGTVPPVVNSDGPLRLPLQLGQRAQRGATLVEWLPGSSLADLLAARAVPRGSAARLGAALAALHRQPAGPGRRRVALSVQLAVRDTARLLRVIEPTLGPRLERFVARVLPRIDDPRALAPIHGDCHPAQIVLDGETVGLIDLDELCLGHPGDDLASIVAHLDLAVLRGAADAGAAGAFSQELIDAHAAASMTRARNLDTHLALALFALAPRPFRDRQPDWPEASLVLVERALAYLEGGDRGARGPHAATPMPSRDPVDDPALPQLRHALQPAVVEAALRALPAPAISMPLLVTGARLIRHKPGRRAVIAYALAGGAGGPVQAIGKLRAKGLDTRAIAILRALGEAGFAGTGAGEVAVPAVLAVLPSLGVWLQARVPGEPLAALLRTPDAVSLMARTGRALARLHGAAIDPGRSHTMADELATLERRVDALCAARPDLEVRVERLHAACAAAAQALSGPRAVLHRDCYADHVIVDGPRLFLIDLDLCAWGHPAIDVGNLAAHVIEQAVRDHDPIGRVAPLVDGLTGAYVRASGHALAPAIDTCTTLSLARLAALSVVLPGRAHTTDRLLALCESRLSLAAPAAPSRPRPFHAGATP